MKQKPSVLSISVLCCFPVEKFNVLLECLLPYMHAILYPKCISSGIQATVKPNELLSVMTVRRNDFYNGVMTYMPQFGGSIYPHNFYNVGSFYGSNISMVKYQT